MNPVTDMTMAINTTFGEIINQIQLSNLNFCIQLTPFGANITLKKSVQKDLNGVPLSPSPPVLFLLQQVHQEHQAMKAENYELKAASEILKNKLDTIVNENIVLNKSIEEKTNTVEILEAANKNMLGRLDLIEREQMKCCAAKAATEVKIKENKKKHTEEIRDLQAELSKLSKTLKTKHKIENDLNNARETIKTLKLEKSSLKTCKTKLEGESRKLKKKLKIIESKQNWHTKEVAHDNDNNENVCQTNDTNANYMTESVAIPAVEFHMYPIISPSMVSHWNPIYLSNIPQNPDSIKSMIAHCNMLPPPEEDKFLSKEDFLELFAEHREQEKKVWAEILSKISNLSIELGN